MLLKNKDNLILVTGATGYIGGRLIPELLKKGWRVRASSRSIEKLKSRPWAAHPSVELMPMDVFSRESLERACAGCGAAFYLVHSMLPGQKDFQTADREAAENMKAAAEGAGLERLIYLGGLGEDSPDLSKHLKSRAEVGKILRSGRVPVTILRAAMIIGSGSASFEILRYLVERLPLMITPKWLKTLSQPVAIRNVLEYLSGCLERPETAGKIYDIGGPDILTYHDLMRIYAEEAGLPKRLVIPVPVLTPRLSSYWIHIVTPVPASIARPLAEGLKNPVLCRESEIRSIIPQELLSCRDAIRLALERLKHDAVPSRWTDAGKMPPVEALYEGDPRWAGGTLFEDRRSCQVKASPAEVWNVVSRIGGDNGWYYADWLWVFRGVLDRLAGGVGLRRGRRHSSQIFPGDALDFWRAAQVSEGKRLLLTAEMKLPGKASLEFKIIPAENGQCVLEQTARFWPRGLLGILYWYLVSPLHTLIFSGMMNSIGKRAEHRPLPSAGN